MNGPVSSFGTSTAQTKRGSVLVTALVLAAVIAIALGSYLQMSRTSLDLAHRGFYSNVAVNLAETGLEQAMAELNGRAWSTPGWSAGGGGMQGRFSSTYAGNVSGFVRVFVNNPTPAPGTSPTLYARATVTPHRGSVIEKWLTVNCSLGASPWVGLVAQTIGVSGGAAIFDSYRSKIDGAIVEFEHAIPGTSPTEYNRNANITLVALSTEAESVDGSNSKIFGYIAVGADEDEEALSLHRNAMLTGDFNAPPRTQDDSRVTHDAALSIPRVSQPTGGTPHNPTNITSTTTLASGTYSLTSVALNGSGSDLIIPAGAEVALHIPTTSLTDTVFKVGGGGRILLGDGAILKIYTQGDVSITGNNVVNSGIPEQLQVYGTRSPLITDRQEITLGGQGLMKAIVHAPDSVCTLNGGGSTGHYFGSMVCFDARLTGGAHFTWDETLKDKTDLRPWRATQWIELTTAAERAAVENKLSFVPSET